MAEKSHPIKKYLFLKHFHSIFKVNHIHSKKSIHLLTAIFLLRKVAFSQIEYISRASYIQLCQVSLSILFLEYLDISKRPR